MNKSALKGLLKSRIVEKFRTSFSRHDFHQYLDISRKNDQSLVTEIDLFVSRLIKDVVKGQPEFKQHHFFSEEEQESFAFPCIIVDPIDGTRGMAQGISECAVSLAIMQSPDVQNHRENWGWIFNPFTGFEISTDDQYCDPPNSNQEALLGMVSRSEWNRGLYQQFNNQGKVIVSPRGSIALKLGLMAAGSADFIITKRPKSVWDIAAGTLICRQRGFKMYDQSAEITRLDTKSIKNPLIWCRDEHHTLIVDSFLK